MTPATTAESTQRRDNLRALLESAGVDALIVSKPHNVRYLSGFTGSSSALRVTGSDATLVTDSRYGEQAATEAPDCSVEVAGGAPTLIAAMRAGVRRIGFESEAVSYDQWERMAEIVQGKNGGVLVPCRGLVEQLRVRKSPSEIALIQRAADIITAAYTATLPSVGPGAVEQELALAIEESIRRDGAEGMAFDPIVASGPRSALPHGRASTRRIEADEFVVFDIGACFEGYHSDMTRTVFTGKPDGKATLHYKTVLEAQQKAIETIAPGIAASEVDRAAREVINNAGHGERFGHATGHGVGLEVHEAPRVGSIADEVLEPGMVITVEPGIYIPGEAGVRIEDMVLVEERGHRVLTPLPKNEWGLE